MKQNLKIILIWVSLYAIAMAFVESSVVVYLRAMFYPQGFGFPMKTIGNHLAATEFFRELSTMLMLLAVSFLSGKTKLQRFAMFVYAFAVWDIFYYVFLKIILGWPLTFTDWDLLFLIPFPWVGPVIAPVICSSLMIILAFVLIFKELKKGSIHVLFREWVFLSTGSIVVVVSFVMDYLYFLNKYYSWKEVLLFSWISEGSKLSALYIPNQFNWVLFISGIIVIVAGIVSIMIHPERKEHKKTHSEI